MIKSPNRSRESGMIQSKCRIGIVICSTREHRLGEQAAQWLLEFAAATRGDMEFQLGDLRDYPLDVVKGVKSFGDVEHLESLATTMLVELAWWTKVLRLARSVSERTEIAA